MNIAELRPKKRSDLRIRAGTWFYTWKRYGRWLAAARTYSSKKEAAALPYPVFRHQTPLLRKLKDVDMAYQYNKIKNLKIAVERLNSIVIYPGETFSYWKLIGRPTARKGYQPGMILHCGSFKMGTGGGLCQLSNLIYWMTLHTPLTVTERHRHSYDVFPDSNRNQPFGSGATCAYNYLDLQITNHTEEPYQLILYLTDEYLCGEWRTVSEPLYTYMVYERSHAITPAYWGGYVRHNEIFRRSYNRQGRLYEDEYVTENHAIMMYEPLLEGTARPD
ncbi:vancomycin resistance protein [Bacillus sp. OG2]|nr:vancomycin resistance protein [Bacillus sp. OG2]